jgi:acetylglutamate kinase
VNGDDAAAAIAAALGADELLLVSTYQACFWRTTAASARPEEAHRLIDDGTRAVEWLPSCKPRCGTGRRRAASTNL